MDSVPETKIYSLICSHSTIGFIAIAVQLIINFKVMFIPESGKGKKTGKIYRFLMLSVFAYYITDVFWGILAGLNWIPLLFVDTTVYYVAMSPIIVCFYIYFVEYLEMRDWKGHLFTLFGKCFFTSVSRRQFQQSDVMPNTNNYDEP